MKMFTAPERAQGVKAAEKWTRAAASANDPRVAQGADLIVVTRASGGPPKD
jgi:hypothetical protein